MFFAAMSGARCQGGDYDHPIVFIVDGDPIPLGLVVCLNRPGGSITAYRGSGEPPTATTPPTSVMNSRRFISNPAPSCPRAVWRAIAPGEPHQRTMATSVSDLDYSHFRSSLITGHSQCPAACLKGAHKQTSVRF